MSQANSNTYPIRSRRAVLTGIAAAGAAIGVATKAVALPLDDSELLKLEEMIFEQQEQATAFDDEIWRLHVIWVDEFKRLNEEARQGRCTLTPDERWALVGELPLHTRLARLQDPFNDRTDALIKQMWQIPARTAEGRRAKATVLLHCVGSGWQEIDKDTDYPERLARTLLIEFVGGEPAEMLRGQFAKVQP
jgi:hypothetical protein